MTRKLNTNRNLTLFSDSIYTASTTYKADGYNNQVIRDLPVFCSHTGLLEEHLNSCLRVVNDALEDHPRTLAIRVDLRVPNGVSRLPDQAISHFMDTFKDKIKRDRRRAARVQQYAKPCKVRYLWVRERDTAQHDHFHVLLLLNQDAYPSLGQFKSDHENLAKRIDDSWAMALGICSKMLGGCVEFPKNGEYFIDASVEPDDSLLRLIESEDWSYLTKKQRYKKLSYFCDRYEGLFYRVSYFCKANTKIFGRGLRSFGCSRLKR